METFAVIRRLIVATFTLLVASISNCPSYAQSGPFTGMAGNWSGGGTVTLDDGSTEKIRCRATYEGGSLSGTWSESSRGVSGTLQGRGSNGNFQVVASAAGFNANISLTTRGNKQSVVIRAESQFRGASIALSRR